jgi:hypothetical protein
MNVVLSFPAAAQPVAARAGYSTLSARRLPTQSPTPLPEGRTERFNLLSRRRERRETRNARDERHQAMCDPRSEINFRERAGPGGLSSLP